MSFDKTQWVWQDGTIVPWSKATVHISATGLQYGAGVFEGIRCYETREGPALFRMKSHLDRFYASAARHDMQIPYSHEDLECAVAETVRRNGFTSCYVRPISYYGSGRPGILADGCPIRVAILCWPWAPLLGVEGQQSGVRVTISKWVKLHFTMLPTTAKACGGYLNATLAAKEARSRGYDEALMLDADGNISEGPTENIFIVHNNTLITNDERSSILLGITRDSVITIARNLGYTVEIKTIRLDDLRSASEAFFTGTAAEITPIRELDGTSIGCGQRGPITQTIQNVFWDITSARTFAYRDWLHFVTTDARNNKL
jgi:branched-chain amino acid aminotransferase